MNAIAAVPETGTEIQNPLMGGFAPDPSIVRVGNDYYIATSTFEWWPGIRIHHSRNLRDWEIIGHVLQNTSWIDLRGVHPSGGVWAPCLTYHQPSSTFYAVFSVMRNQTGNQFDVDNYVCTTTDIRGPWTAPKYLSSIGFDPSLFHDDDGRTWMVTLEWDPREGYEHPGTIVLEEFDPASTSLIGGTTRIAKGSTDRGCVEAPHLYKHDGTYYLMTAEGGTGYGHCVAMARSTSLTGPWESSPHGPVLTGWAPDYYGRLDLDYMKTRFYDPLAEVHKAGHGSLVDTPNGEWFIAHLGSRPIRPAAGSILGRETFLQQVQWTDDGWLELEAGGRTAKAATKAPAGLDETSGQDNRFRRNDFNGPLTDKNLMAPRQPVANSWADTAPRTGHVRVRGRESLFSRFDVSLLAVRLQALEADIETRVECSPRHFSHAAGLVIYYDNENFTYLRVYHSDSLGGRALGVINARKGLREELVLERVALPGGPVDLRASIHDGYVQFSWSGTDSAGTLREPIDISNLSDEGARGFTGLSIGITAQDAARRDFYADFDYLAVDYT